MQPVTFLNQSIVLVLLHFLLIIQHRLTCPSGMQCAAGSDLMLFFLYLTKQ